MTEHEIVSFIFSDKGVFLFGCVIVGIFMIQLYITFLVIRGIIRAIVKHTPKVEREEKYNQYEQDLKPKYEWQSSEYSEKTREEKAEEINKLFGDRW